MADVMQKFDYCFVQPQGSDYPPILNARDIAEPFAPFAIAGPGGACRRWPSASTMATSARWDSASAAWPIRPM